MDELDGGVGVQGYVVTCCQKIVRLVTEKFSARQTELFHQYPKTTLCKKKQLPYYSYRFNVVLLST